MGWKRKERCPKCFASLDPVYHRDKRGSFKRLDYVYCPNCGVKQITYK